MTKSNKITSVFVPSNSIDSRRIEIIKKSMIFHYKKVTKTEINTTLRHESLISSSALLLCIEVEKRIKTTLLNKVFPKPTKIKDINEYIQKDKMDNINVIKANYFKNSPISVKELKNKEKDTHWENSLINQHIESGSFNDVINILKALKLLNMTSVVEHFNGICKDARSLISVLRFINYSRNQLVHELSLFKIKKNTLSTKKWLSTSGTAAGYNLSPIKTLAKIELDLIRTKILHRKSLTGAISSVDGIKKANNAAKFINLYI